MNESSNIPFAYFGSSRLSVIVLNELKKLGLIPSLIVTTPDKPQGRKLIMTPNVVKAWAIENNIKVLSPAKLDKEFIATLTKENLDLFIVASYGKIIPNEIIEMPAHKTLNIHPSLLPRYRGASPLPTAMLDDAKLTGITIMRLDSEMDHGPIYAQRSINLTDHFKDWPTYEVFEEFMAKEGAKLLAETMPSWIKTDPLDLSKIAEVEQDHAKATYTKKITKEDGLIDLNADPYENFRKIQAYHQWPQAYFFIDSNGKQMRIKITDASFTGESDSGKLTINKVIPEGKKEMSYDSFAQGYL